MSSNNGRSNGTDDAEHGSLELREILHVETKDGRSLPFEVVGVLEDPESGGSYAVLLHEGESDEDQEFIVTDLDGNLLEDEELAQEVLDDFLAFAEEAGEEGS